MTLDLRVSTTDFNVFKNRFVETAESRAASKDRSQLKNTGHPTNAFLKAFRFSNHFKRWLLNKPSLFFKKKKRRRLYKWFCNKDINRPNVWSKKTYLLSLTQSLSFVARSVSFKSSSPPLVPLFLDASHCLFCPLGHLLKHALEQHLEIPAGLEGLRYRHHRLRRRHHQPPTPPALGRQSGCRGQDTAPR